MGLVAYIILVLIVAIMNISNAEVSFVSNFFYGFLVGAHMIPWFVVGGAVIGLIYDIVKNRGNVGKVIK